MQTARQGAVRTWAGAAAAADDSDAHAAAIPLAALPLALALAVKFAAIAVAIALLAIALALALAIAAEFAVPFAALAEIVAGSIVELQFAIVQLAAIALTQPTARSSHAPLDSAEMLQHSLRLAVLPALAAIALESAAAAATVAWLCSLGPLPSSAQPAKVSVTRECRPDTDTESESSSQRNNHEQIQLQDRAPESVSASNIAL